MRGLKAVLAAVSICAVSGVAGSAWALPPVEAFGALPFLAQPQLSPDGKHFAGVQDLDGKPAAVIYGVGVPGPPQVFASTEWLVHSVHWVKNDRLVMFTKATKTVPFGDNPDLYTWYRALSLEVGGSDWVQLFDRRNESVSMNSSTAVIVDKMLNNPDEVLIPLWTRPANSRHDNDPEASISGGYGNDYRLSLYRVNVHTGRAFIVQDGGKQSGNWLSDGNGGVVGRVEWTVTPSTGHLLLYHDGSWNGRRDFPATRGNHVVGLTHDGAALVFSTPNEQGRIALFNLDRTTGATGAALFSDPRYDVSYTLEDDWTRRVIGVAYMADKMQYVYFDPARQALQRGIEQVFPGLDAHAVSVTQDGSKAIVATEAPTQPRTFYFLDRDTHVATKIASEYPGLTAADLGAMRPYPYKARDGLDIPAYLTTPPGRAATHLPLVVMAHGPDARDAMGFDWEAQFLANRGYAVFQPNYRGSEGYGHDFNAAGFGQWGLKMQDDIVDGVKKLIADGIVDPKRVCIIGTGYGGYIALAGVTTSPDLYACAASIGGPSDLGRLTDTLRRRYGKNSPMMEYWDERLGTDAASLDAASPALHADRVQAPVLLLHSKLDATIAFAQSEEERDALQRAGKPVELVPLEGDDHYFTLASTRIQMLSTLERFLGAHIGQ